MRRFLELNLGRLLQEEEKQRDLLLQTMRVFFDVNGSHEAASQRLGVHRKTIAQRRKETQIRLKEAILRHAAHEELEAIGEEGEAEPPVSYSNAAYQQMLQTLRRFIDETDWFERFCLVVLTSPGFYDGASDRSYFNYDALQTRIGLEVHDATRAYPVASLVHLAESK